MKIKAVIFDLDGTIIDTEPTAVSVVQKSLTEWAIPFQNEDIHFVTGRTWAVTFDFLFNKYAFPLPRPKAEAVIMDAYRQAIQESLVTVPGSVQAVQRLAAHFPLALVSGSNRSEILWALSHLKILDHFQFVLGAEDYPQSKPHPDGYLLAMKQLRIQPNECLIFEDSLAGISSARAAGAWVAAITSTNYFNQDTSHAHWHIPNLLEVSEDWIQKL